MIGLCNRDWGIQQCHLRTREGEALYLIGPWSQMPQQCQCGTEGLKDSWRFYYISPPWRAYRSGFWWQPQMSTASTEFARLQDVKTDRQRGSGGGMLSSVHCLLLYHLESQSMEWYQPYSWWLFLAQLNHFGNTQVHPEICFHGDS